MATVTSRGGLLWRRPRYPRRIVDKIIENSANKCVDSYDICLATTNRRYATCAVVVARVCTSTVPLLRSTLTRAEGGHHF